MREKLYQTMIELTNGKWSSSLIRSFTKSSVSRRMIPYYINYFNISTQDTIQKSTDFTSLHDFFIRKVKVESRPIDREFNSIISPVDATIETFGDITGDGLFYVKQKTYTLQDMLGSEKIASSFQNGKYIILYLSPAEYHRIHSPVDGKVLSQYSLGEKSYPVNKWGLQYGKQTISGNYRMLTELEMPNEKKCIHIKVGAMFVNSIELTNNSTVWNKGEEVGYFSFGSTVVMLFEADSVVFSNKVHPGKFVRMGENVANML